jgi:hypothetical protein
MKWVLVAALLLTCGAALAWEADYILGDLAGQQGWFKWAPEGPSATVVNYKQYEGEQSAVWTWGSDEPSFDDMGVTFTDAYIPGATTTLTAYIYMTGYMGNGFSFWLTDAGFSDLPVGCIVFDASGSINVWDTEFNIDTGSTWVTGQWFLMEWRIHTATNTHDLYIDGTPVFVGRATAQPIIGIGGLDIWADDLVESENGCNAMFVDNLSVQVPEPGLLSLVGLALGGIAAVIRRR